MASAGQARSVDDDPPNSEHVGRKESAASVPTVSGTRPKRGGGPRTPKGKRIASQNSTRHGILSRSPIVGDEQLEDWEAFLDGFFESFLPVGALEDTLVYGMALNRWQCFRLDRWQRDRIEAQVAMADFASRDALELALASLPEDEARWVGYDAADVLDALDTLMRCSEASELAHAP